MDTKIVPIGNSRGVRIPKALLEQSGIEDAVRLEVVDGGILISARRRSRAGWAEAARRIAEARRRDSMLDRATSTRFDGTRWSWE